MRKIYEACYTARETETMECDCTEKPAINTFRRQAHVTQPKELTVTGQIVVRLLRMTRALTWGRQQPYSEKPAPGM